MPMSIRLPAFWHLWIGTPRHNERAMPRSALNMPPQTPGADLEMAPDDPLVAFLQTVSGVVDVGSLDLASPALRTLRAAGVTMAVPLVSQGHLIGLLNLGPRRSQQDYSAEDRALLSSLATQAAPALRVGQLVRQQQAEARVRERMEQELHIARLIQQTLLPKALPVLPGWEMAAHYQPAREVGGDFYDFLTLPDGRLGIIVADVTDKGVPAALVMATTRSILRGATQRLASPGAVLERTNELLCPDIPSNMFVACFYAILDPASGHLQYANAGQDLPYVRQADGVSELRATGMPLGLMPGMRYEEKEATLRPGESVLFYSDGLVEAHNRRRDMFGFPQLRTLVAEYPNPGGDGAKLIHFLLSELARFTGDGWEQEDDITLVTLRRCVSSAHSVSLTGGTSEDNMAGVMGDDAWRILDEWTVPSEPGNERPAMERVGEVVCPLHLPPQRLERLKTAVSEATMNAIEHGNQSRPELPVVITVLASERVLAVRVTDQGGHRPIHDPETPDLEAKLEGRQTPRGWGLFLIKNLVDDVRVSGDDAQRTVELLLYREGDAHASKTL